LDLSRQIEQLARRVDRVTILQAPPKLSMVTVQPGDELPPPSPWRMTVAIEPKRVVAS
jgi:hypothetical protein